MTVKEFFENFDSLMKFNVNLYEVNEHIEINMTVNQIKREDGLYKEWKNARVYDWTVYDRQFNLNVIK